MQCSTVRSSASGIATGTAASPRRSVIEAMARSKSAPGRSILLMNTMRGTSCLFAWRQTVSVWGSTPRTPSITITAPSSTRMDRSTSIVKSTWPGVSTIWIRWPCHGHCVTAAEMVIPCSCSSGMVSMCDAPSWTSPILCEAPV